MSTTFTLPAKTRTMIGHQAKKLAKNDSGLLPAVVYSKKTGSQSIEVNYRQTYKMIKQAGTTQVINLEIEMDGKTKIQPSLVHDIDVHPVKGTLRHVDFLAVNLKEKIIATVPVVYVGEPTGVKEFGGVLVINIDEVEVEALPNKLPEEITVDVSILANIHDSVLLGDLPTNKDYVIITDTDLPFAILSSQTVEAETTEEAPVTEVVKGTKPVETEAIAKK
jgi:large subunit ribosomal protein L25